MLLVPALEGLAGEILITIVSQDTDSALKAVVYVSAPGGGDVSGSSPVYHTLPWLTLPLLILSLPLLILSLPLLIMSLRLLITLSLPLLITSSLPLLSTRSSITRFWTVRH